MKLGIMKATNTMDLISAAFGETSKAFRMKKTCRLK
jgi:hypothetical protein